MDRRLDVGPLVDELAGARRRDTRRTERLEKIAVSLGRDCQRSFPQALKTEAELEGFYWFWNSVPRWNDTVGPIGATALMNGLAAGRFGLIAKPGIWRMTAIVGIISEVAPAYDMRNTWHYQIFPGRRQDAWRRAALKETRRPAAASHGPAGDHP